MQQLIIKPAIFRFESCGDFASEFDLGSKDLLITNERIFKKYFEPLNLKCAVMFREKYGRGEPTDAMADAMAGDVPPEAERIISVGGGSILDLSKLLVLERPSPAAELFEGRIAPVKIRKLVLVPTTCGTGSEVTNISILSLLALNTKKGLASDTLYADYAVLIPELLEDLPFRFFAPASIDALIHAVESSLSPKGNETTRLFGYKAIELILNGYKRIREQGEEARLSDFGDYLLAANYAGIAFGNAGCAAVHALSYPFGAAYHVAHGESNYVIFSGVMNCYLSVRTDGEIARLMDFIAGILGCSSKDAFTELGLLLGALLPEKELHEYGVTEADLKAFTDSVMLNQGRLMANSFVPLSKEQVYGIYKSRF